jgi:hypothetical protein
MKASLSISVIIVGLLSASCTNNPAKDDKIRYDSKNRFTCAGYSLIDYGIDQDAPVEFYYANTDRLVCTFEMLARICAPTEPNCSCPPKKWADNCWDQFGIFLEEKRVARRLKANAVKEKLKNNSHIQSE